MKTKLLLLSTVAIALGGCGGDAAKFISGNINDPASVSIDGTPAVGETLSADIADGNRFDSGDVIYTWLADGAAIDGASSGDFTVTDAQAGAVITVSVRFIDNNNFPENTSSEGVEIPVPVVNTAATVTIAGSAVEGETLTATVVDANGFDAATVVYAWLADGTAIAGATASTFTLTAAQVGAAITVSASFDDSDGFTEAAVSAATAAVNVVNVAGTVAITGDTTSGSTLTATVTDTNGATGTIAYAWDADGTAISGATSMTYVLTDAENGTDVTVTASYTDDDGYSESVTDSVSIPVPAPTNTAATFASLEATTFNDVATGLSGTVVVTDPDTGEAGTEAQSGVTTTYGTFSIDTAGAWTYTLDTANATIAALASSDASVVDSINIDSTDGTPETLDITIIGNDDSVTNSRVAVIRDTDSSDTGELRYSLPTALAQGRLEVKFTREDDSLGSADAFISLFNENNNNDGSILDLRVTDSEFRLRNPETTIDTAVAAPSLGDTLQTAIVTWEYPGGDTAVAPQVTVEIDGVSLTGSAAVTLDATGDAAPFGGVTTVSFRLGNNSGTLPTTATFTIDDIAVFDDTAGASVVFVDSFESDADGTNLDPDADSTSVYASNTSEAVVEAVAAAPPAATGLGVSGNQFANVTDVAGTSADAMDDAGGTQIVALLAENDTGELRIDLGSANTIEVGRMTFQMLKGTESNTGIDGFVLIGGVDTGDDEALLDLRLDQSGNHYDIRGGDTELGTYNTDTIYDVEISWDASAATETVAPTIEITIDSVSLFSGNSPSVALAEAQNGVRYIQFRVADSDDITRADFRLDELVVYQTVGGTESIAFEDDFEAYTAGESLDPNVNDAGDLSIGTQTPAALIKSEYNSNSFSVVVDVED